MDRARRLVREWYRKSDPLTNLLPPLVNIHTDNGPPAPALDLEDSEQRRRQMAHLGKICE